MLRRLDKTRQRWGGEVTLIDKWLDNRQLLLIDYCHLVKAEETSHYQTLPDSKQLTSFCGKLVDYLSLGHFEVYQSILAQYQKEGVNTQSLLNTLLPQIQETTSPCLDFNDKYMNLEQDDAQLEYTISDLGESLAKRFDLEDALIEELYRASQA